MPQVDRIYKLAFRRHFTNHECNFPLSKEIALGDYGTIEHGYFMRIGSVKDPELNIGFDVRIDENPSHEQFNSTSDISLDFVTKAQASAAGVGNGNAQLKIGFGSENSVFFSSPEVRYNEIADIGKLGADVIALYNAGKWNKKYYIVTRQIEGAAAIVVISGSSSSKATLEASAETERIDLSQVALNLSFTQSNAVKYQLIFPSTCTLGMGLSRIYDSIFLHPAFRTANSFAEYTNVLDHRQTTNVVFGDTTPAFYDQDAVL